MGINDVVISYFVHLFSVSNDQHFLDLSYVSPELDGLNPADKPRRFQHVSRPNQKYLD